MIKDKVFYCNIELALDVIGGKWKPLIIYHLSHLKTIRFGEFTRLIPNISESVLSRTLRELEENRIIIRKDYHENPPKVEYYLSEEGHKIAPTIVELGNWGKTYNASYEYANMEFINQYKDDQC